jgi:LmbE family N-acetylglucosaminyl deacetylase
MKDCALESVYYPINMLDIEAVRGVVCLAPHPDDEVIGCGGFLSLVARHRIDLLTIVITSGQAQSGNGLDREQESRNASSTLGLPAPECWGYQDRALSASLALSERIEDVLRERRPSHVLVPALSEPHPDHQALALAACRAAVKSGLDDLILMFYEVGAPMVPNTRVDISAVAEKKWQAIRCFLSQLAVLPYLRAAQAMASLRAHGLKEEVSAAEAFYCVSVPDLREKGHSVAVPTVAATRHRLGLAQGINDLPLVSVLVRSMGRPSLIEALHSVGLQHYPILECVLVCAHGQSHVAEQFPEGLRVREVFGPDRSALGRAQAANLALDSARGDFLIFLDDDDLLEPDHISRLVSALGEKPSAPAAYAGVRLENAEGCLIRDYDLPWSWERLQALNYLPIHAVLFRRASVVERQLRFREDLPVLEDWDFWRRLSEVGAFVHVPGVSARYRRLDSGSGVSQNGENDWKIWQQRLLLEQSQQASRQDQVSLLMWHARELDALEHHVQTAEVEHARLRSGFEQQIRVALAERDRRVHAHEVEVRELLAEISRLHVQYGQQLREAIESRESIRAGFLAQLQQLEQSRDSLHSGYQAQIRDLDLDRSRLREGYEDQMKALLSDRDALRMDRDSLKQKLGYIVNSRIWRYSAPLREVLRWLTHRQ